ncbi:MAG: hypothetical protein AAF281_02600 [Pseudomonadota bacterium]
MAVDAGPGDGAQTHDGKAFAACLTGMPHLWSRRRQDLRQRDHPQNNL